MADNKYYRLDENGLSHLWQRIKLMVTSSVSGKVDKETGKVLSSNDFTTEEKNKLAGIAAGAQKNVQPDWTATTGDGAIKNKPSIPTKVSELTNDSKYQTEANVSSTVSTAINGVSGSVTGTGTYPYVTSATLTGGKLAGKTGDISTVINSMKSSGTLVDRDTARSDATEIVSSAIKDVSGVKFEKVSSLPTKYDVEYDENKMAGIIFLVPQGRYSTESVVSQTPVVTQAMNSDIAVYAPSADSSITQNIYDEYIYVGNDDSGEYIFEKIGSTDIDLSGYALKAEIPTKVSQLPNDSGYAQYDSAFESAVVNLIPALTETQIDNICPM